MSACGGRHAGEICWVGARTEAYDGEVGAHSGRALGFLMGDIDLDGPGGIVQLVGKEAAEAVQSAPSRPS